MMIARKARAATMLLDQARAEIQEIQGERHAPSIGRLMASMAGLDSRSMGITAIEAKDEWRRADANALILADQLMQPGRFAARPGRRDCFIADWDWLRSEQRAMATTPGSKGGYMVGSEMLPAADPLWQDSIIGMTGVQIIEGLTGNATIPRGTGAVTTTWSSAENAGPSAADAAVGSASVVAKTIIATVQCSVQLALQAPSLQAFLVRLLLRSVRATLDTALLQGTGASGQPMGLANLPTASGIQQVSGTSLAWAGILSAQKLASASGVPDSRMAWVGAPTVRETLAQREKVSTSGRFIWDDGEIANSPALSSPDAPASTLFVGDFSQCVLALFGPGIEIRFDPHNDYAGGKVAYQVLAVCDIVFPQPAAFVRISSIT